MAPELSRWRHTHTFGQDQMRPGERRTLWVIGITAVTMVVEIGAGVVFGSMALLADGLHMASHAVALGISAVAYVYARRRCGDPRFSLGTGKVNALAGFAGALLLAVFALLMAGESGERFVHPVGIAFDQAIAVAVLGLVVNGLSVRILGGAGHHHGGEHAHAQHEHGGEHAHAQHEHGGEHAHAQHAHGGKQVSTRVHAHDHNLRSAYLHVLADALTSVMAIAALLAGKYLGWGWMDPLMGVVGSVLVARWSWGLLRDTSKVLLDHQAPEDVRDQVRAALEGGTEDRLVDLHVWAIGPGIYAAAITLVAAAPSSPDDYRKRIPDGLGVVHVTIEVHPRDADTELVAA